VASIFAPCRGQSPDFRPLPVAAKKPRVSSEDQAFVGMLQKLVMPSGACTDIEATMRATIPYVQERLRECLNTGQDVFSQFQDNELHLHEPLVIKESVVENEMVSFKAPWTATDALASLRSTTMYEAGGNLVWCNPFPSSPEAVVVAGDPVIWEHVKEAAEVHFGVSAMSRGNAISRIVFPIALPIHVDDEVLIRSGIFASALPLVSGHVYVYAWWVAMFNALDEGNTNQVAALWQCALTVTMSVRMGMSHADLAIFSIQQSELRKNMAGICRKHTTCVRLQSNIQCTIAQ